MNRIIAAVAIAACTLVPGALRAQSVDSTISVRSGARFELQSVSGVVHIRAWNRSQVRVQAESDGARVDLDGNLWTGAGQGVQVFTPEAEKIGVIRLPETCANLCFGGAKRNRLFMAASQSLYAVYVNTAGAHIA